MMGRGVLILFVFVLVLSSSFVFAVAPSAGIISEESSERASAGTPTGVEAQAGNLSELNIIGYSITQAWQGYFGNVTGAIQLGNANNDIIYNWTLANPEGEIYASRSDAVDWSSIQCFNFSATGNEGDDTGEIAGGTSQKGMSLTQAESAFNIGATDVDGIDETFSLAGTHEQGRGYSHSLFYTNNLEFSAGECVSTHLFSSGGVVDDLLYEEVLLYDFSNDELVFASLLDDSASGFDDAEHDFEMLVLEDGHGTNTATTTYYFYVELQ